MKQKFINRFDSKGTNIQSLIEIDGYYQCIFREKSTDRDKEVDTLALNLVFWNDGTFANNFFFNEKSTEESISKNFEKNLYYFYHGEFAGYYGIYRISGDTIILQYVNHPGKIVPWFFSEMWFKIIDRKTLKLIGHFPLEKEVIELYGTNVYMDELQYYSPYNFKKADSIPPPLCWLKEEKWLWKDENDWVKYMESIKKKKRK